MKQIVALLFLLSVGLRAQTLVTVAGTVKDATGTAFTGTVNVAWQTMTCSTLLVPGGSKTTAVTAGALSLPLYSTTGCTNGTSTAPYYTVRYYGATGRQSDPATEKWIIPSSPSTTTVDAIRSATTTAANTTIVLGQISTSGGTDGQVLALSAGSPAWVTLTTTPTWGAITGTLSSQTDLSSALSAKIDTSDSRLSDARTPLSHASTHATAGSDPLTLSESQVTNLITDLSGKAATSHAHAASDVTSGALALGRGGTGADLSSTGGTAQVLKQTTSGGAVTVGTVASTDLSDSSGLVRGAESLGTAGYVPFVSSSGVLGTNNGFFWDNVNNRLGIGSTAPDSTLMVSGSNGNNPLFKVFRPNPGSGAARFMVQNSNTDAFVLSTWGYSSGASDTLFGQNVTWNDASGNTRLNTSNTAWYIRFSNMADRTSLYRISATGVEKRLLSANASGVAFGEFDALYTVDVAGQLRVQDRTATTGATRAYFNKGAADSVSTNIIRSDASASFTGTVTAGTLAGSLAASYLGTMTGATSSVDGAKGAVPAPSAGDDTKYLRGDGTWATVPSSGSVTSVGLSLPSDLTVSGSPVTTSGTLTAVWASTPTGTGAIVRDTSPTLTTPTLVSPTITGTATFGDGTTVGGVTLYELAANGDNYRKITVPSSLAADWTIRFPDTVPSADSILLVPAPTGGVSEIGWTETTGTGNVVRATSPTIVTPTIASFSNATHTHQDSAGGGTLDAVAIASGTLDPARLPYPASSAKGGILTTTCSFGQYATGYDTSGAPVCSTPSGSSSGLGTVFAMSNNASSLSAASTVYYAPNWSNGSTAGTANRAWPIPVSGTVDSLYIYTNSPQPSVCKLVATVMYGSNPSAMLASPVAVTVSAGSAAGMYSNTSSTQSVTAGQLLVLRIQNTDDGGTCASNSASVIGFAFRYH